MHAPVADAGLLSINATLPIELVTFVAMVIVLGKWVYPRIVQVAEARQREIVGQLESAEKARHEAEARLHDAEASLKAAQAQAREVIDGAARSADQLRRELRERAEEDAKRITEHAQGEIEAERRRAVDSLRGEIADLVVAATEKVVVGALDPGRQRQLVELAVKEVVQVGAAERNGGGDGKRKR